MPHTLQETLAKGREMFGARTKGVSQEIPPSWFHQYQLEAWESEHPIIAICAGWQSGKTVFLSPWLLREIQRMGPGDYGAFSSTYKLLERKYLPELKKQFEPYSEFKSGVQQFQFTDAGSRLLWGSKWNGDPTVIQLGHAENPDSLESATLKAVAWDEPGQRLVPHDSFLTVSSRLMNKGGRMALASRPYESGWYEDLVKEGTAKTEDGEPNKRIKVVSFPSWANPTNPGEFDDYYVWQRSIMPEWKFTIRYRGQFTRPLGMIYDCFDEIRHTCEDFVIPLTWRWSFFPGVDFGGVNTAGIIIAEDPHSKELYGVHEYHTGTKNTTASHAKGIKEGIDANGNAVKFPLTVGAGGSHQEEGWRESASSAGLFLDEPPENDVEVQIQCVYEQLALGKLKFFKKACSRTIGQIKLYSREVDDNGDVTDKIADKAKWHLMDALRYIITKLRPPTAIPIGPKFTSTDGAQTSGVPAHVLESLKARVESQDVRDATQVNNGTTQTVRRVPKEPIKHSWDFGSKYGSRR